MFFFEHAVNVFGRAFRWNETVTVHILSIDIPKKNDVQQKKKTLRFVHRWFVSGVFLFISLWPNRYFHFCCCSFGASAKCNYGVRLHVYVCNTKNCKWNNKRSLPLDELSSRQSAYHLIESSYAENEMDGPKDYQDDPRRAQYTVRKPQKRLCISVMCVCVAPENSKAETNKKKHFKTISDPLENVNALCYFVTDR